MRLQREFRFLHCADLHLDSPFRGVSRYSAFVAERLREAAFQAFEKVVDLALQEEVDCVLIAGDLYNDADRSLRAQLELQRQLVRLSEAGVYVYVAHGNHDPLLGESADLKLPDKVFCFESSVGIFPLLARGGERVGSIWGYSYPVRDVADNIAVQMIPSQEDREHGLCLAMLHCNVGGIEGHENYAPCSLDDLKKSGMDYWALGHIHRPMILEKGAPWVVYSGTIQGRSIKETGPHGCSVVRVSEQGHISSLFCPTDIVRWKNTSLDISSFRTDQDILNAFDMLKSELREAAEERGLIVRVAIKGRSPLHRSLTRDGYLDDLTAELNCEEERSDFVWIEGCIDESNPDYNLDNLKKTQTFVGDFLREVEYVTSHISNKEELFETIDGALGSSRWRRRDLEFLLEAFTIKDVGDIVKEVEIIGADGLMGEEDDPCGS